MTKERLSIIVVWLVAVAGMIGVALFALPARQVSWASILMLLLVCLTCVIQLGMQKSKGFIARMTASMVGSLMILGIGSLVLLLGGAGAGVGTND